MYKEVIDLATCCKYFKPVTATFIFKGAALNKIWADARISGGALCWVQEAWISRCFAGREAAQHVH